LQEKSFGSLSEDVRTSRRHGRVRVAIVVAFQSAWSKVIRFLCRFPSREWESVLDACASMLGTLSRLQSDSAGRLVSQRSPTKDRFGRYSNWPREELRRCLGLIPFQHVRHRWSKATNRRAIQFSLATLSSMKCPWISVFASFDWGDAGRFH